jgi:hypothetical protein
MNAIERRQLLSSFPFNDFQLSYENKVHNKVRGSHLTLAIPDGVKAYAWMTTWEENNVCLIMEIFNGISNITRLKHEFSVKLSYGTIFYGTSFRCKNGQPSFSIEDVIFYKGKNVCRTNYLKKLELINGSFKNDELKNPEIVFGLPEMSEQFYTVLNAVPDLPYKSSFIHFRYLEGKLTNTVFIMKYIKPRQQLVQPTTTVLTKNVVFGVVADIQPDVYHLTASDGATSIACIPSYTVSVMMNSIFRTIKENVSLDALEESDEEEEFEDIREERYLIVRTEPVKMKCCYNYKFKKWVPISIFC